LALASLTICGVAHLFARLGVAGDPMQTRELFQIGSVLAMLLLFMGPGDRVRGLHLERRAYVESARLKDAFLASMSHELRTPLNAMLGMSDLLDSAALNHEHRAYLEVIRKSGDSMLRMVDSLLDMMSIEAGNLLLESIPFDLHRLINGASVAAGQVCVQKGLGFSIRLEPGLARGYRGDPARLKQVIENVLDNAVKFTDRGSVIVAVRSVRLRESSDGALQDMITIRVADTGIGIAADRREDIFHSFTRIDESDVRRASGLGVGLTMVRNLVRLMGGRVALESRAGEGTAFQISIPLRSAPELFEYERRDAALRGADGEAYGPHAVPAPASDRVGNNALRILLVEDNRDNRLLFHAYMRSTKHEVDVATNGRRAVDKFKAAEYDIVFMDIQMPELDGISATREIRSWESAAFEAGTRVNRVPIYALTAHSLAEEIKRSIEAGCDGHISKPVRKQEILQVLHHI
jgi:signal transduction histidine kinase/ActR/RegA family two-component response regulator